MSVINDQTVNKGPERGVACPVAQGKFGYPVVESKAGAAAVRELGPRLQSSACDRFRKRRIQACWVEQRGQQGPRSTQQQNPAVAPVELHGPMSFSEKKNQTQLGARSCYPQNAEFLMYSYGIFYHLGVFARNLNEAALL